MITQIFKGRSIKHSYDWKLVGIYLALVLFGLANIYASIHSAEPSSVFDLSTRSGMQCLWIASSLGLAALILFAFPARMWESAAIPLYIMVGFLLFAVIFMGVEVKGSRSWFSFGAIRFQPAEISKITTSLLLAFVMSRPGFRFSRMKDFIKVGLVVGIPMLIILGESETGSALVYVGFLFVMYREGLTGWILAFLGLAILLFVLTLAASPYVAVGVLVSIFIGFFFFKNGLRRSRGLGHREKFRFLTYSTAALAAGLLLIFSTDIIFNKVLQEHQRKRIEVLLGIKDDPSGVGYNVNQSMIAIGSGGFSGKGYLCGTQTTYGFVPEQSTDFIFCTVGEEWGFLGCLAVIGLYVALIWRIISNAEKSREHFTRIYGYCVAACLFMHLFINIGMTIGLMPVIGIPLPMMSYGGSSLWAFTILIFIFVVLDHQEKKYF